MSEKSIKLPVEIYFVLSHKWSSNDCTKHGSYMMNKFLIPLTLTISAGLFAAPVPDDLGGICNCDSDVDIGCSDCDDCEPVGDPATAYFGCVPIDTEEDLDDTEEDLDSDIDDTSDEFDENGIIGIVEGTYADYEEVYVIDEETPYSNEIEMTPSWCD